MRTLFLGRGHVNHDIADCRIRLQILAVDVDVSAREYLVDLRKHARHIAVDVQDAAAGRVLGQRDLGEIDRRQGGAVVAVAHQLGRHLDADVVLRLQRAAAHVWGQDHVVHVAQRRNEILVVALGLGREHVDRRARQMPGSQRLGQGVDVHDGAARGIDQHRTRAHAAELGRADHHSRARGFRHVQGDDVGAFEQVVQARCRARVAEGELGFDVVEDHPHAERFGQHADLGADVAVADDAQHLVAHLVAARRRFAPAAAMALRILLRDAAHQQDRFGDHQFGHAAGIGIGRVEHRDAQRLGRIQIHLVGADAEAADADQALGFGQHFGVELGARADADEVGLGDASLQLVLGQRFLVDVDLGIAGGVERLDRAAADAFEQKDADVLLGERGLLHGVALAGGERDYARIRPLMRRCSMNGYGAGCSIGRNGMVSCGS